MKIETPMKYHLIFVVWLKKDEHWRKWEEKRILDNYENNLVISHKIANWNKIGPSNTVTEYLNSRNEVGFLKKI